MRGVCDNQLDGRGRPVRSSVYACRTALIVAAASGRRPSASAGCAVDQQGAGHVQGHPRRVPRRHQGARWWCRPTMRCARRRPASRARRSCSPRAPARAALLGPARGRRTARTARSCWSPRPAPTSADPLIRYVVDDEFGDIAHKEKSFADRVMFWRKGDSRAAPADAAAGATDPRRSTPPPKKPSAARPDRRPAPSSSPAAGGARSSCRASRLRRHSRA